MIEFYIVGGINGAGKTSVIKSSENYDPKYKVAKFGSLMLDIATGLGYNVERDTLRRLDETRNFLLQRKTFEKISRMKRGKIILDTHYAMLNEFGYMPGIPTYAIEMLKPKKLILIEAEIEEIIQRRFSDSTRMRGYEFERRIEEHLFMERIFATICSQFSGASLKIIKNSKDELEKAGQELAETLKWIK